jgi:alpha-L-rhamnosidase
MRAHWRRWLAAGAGVLAVIAVLFVVAVIIPSGAGGAGPDQPDQLKVNLVSQPMTVAPGGGVYFSWVTSDARPGQLQQGYELRVASRPDGLDTAAKAVWDSGTVTAASPGASYGGPALFTGTRYWWEVRTFDAQGRSSQWSAPAQFGTALGAAWQAQPVWSRTPPRGTSSGWSFMRGQLAIRNEPVLAATVYATAGTTEATRQYVFRLSVNGTVIGVGPPRPPNPGTESVYSGWDVTSLLRAGTDSFGALAYSPAHPFFQLELVVQYKDGSRQVWCTGPNWKALDGGGAYPAAGSVSPQYYSAPVEDLDAEKYPVGFDRPGYPTPAAAGWSPAILKSPLTTLIPDTAANVELRAHQPAKITRLGPGRYLLDFGTTQVGGLRLTLDGTAGEQVRILSGEVLSSPDTVQYKLSAGDVYDDTWTLRAGQQTLQYWGFRVFRYVEVTGVPQPLTAANTAALALVYPDQPGQSAVTTSSAALDTVWQFSKATVESLNLGLYLDSPTRERSGAYEGDDYIHQLSQAAVDGDSALAQYSQLFVDTEMTLQETTPIIEFEELAPVAALAQYQQTGDPAVLTQLYGLLKQLLPGKYLGSDGLITMPVNPLRTMPVHPVAGEPLQQVDWPASERDGFVFTRENTVVNAFGYASYAAMAEIAGVVGDQARASADATIAARIRSTMQDKLYDPVTGAFRDGVGTTHEAIQSSAYAVALGVASPGQARTAAADIARQGMACSVYCAAYLLEALYDGGQPQAALQLLTADDSTSWLHMIALGAGSTMEVWTPALKPNLTYSHPWAASPAYIVPGYLFGVSALTPGWRTVLIHPQPGSLTSGSVQVPTPRGAVSVAFTSGGGRFRATVDVPASATAEVVLPGVKASQRVWLDGTARTAIAIGGGTTAGDGQGAPGPAGPGAGGAGAAGLPAVAVGSGWHEVSTAP